jgi:hypothetical protein
LWDPQLNHAIRSCDGTMCSGGKRRKEISGGGSLVRSPSSAQQGPPPSKKNFPPQDSGVLKISRVMLLIRACSSQQCSSARDN